jgi:O-antigen ligase
MEVKLHILICTIVCIAFGLRIFKYPWPVYLFFLYSFMSGIMVSYFPYQSYPSIDKIGYSNLVGIVKSCMFLTILSMIFVHSLELKRPLILIGFVSSLITIFTYFYRGPGFAYGFMTNTSMEATFLAVVAPLVFSLGNIQLIIFPIYAIAIFLTSSSNGIIGFVLGISVYLFMEKKYKLLIIPGLFGLIGAIKYNSIIFNPNGRKEIWTLAMTKWSENFSYLTGSGFGTYGGFGPWIQRVYEKPVNGGWVIYPNLHSDFLQIIFELGIIGIVLAIISYAVAINKAKNRSWLLASVITYAFVSLANMPSRYILTALVGLYLLKETFRHKPY